jgi:SH3 domain-containing YSC84-like protein 1
MEKKNRLNRAAKSSFFIIIFLSFVAASFFPLRVWAAGERQEARHVVEKSRIMFESFMTDNKFEAFRDLLKKAKGVFLVPQLIKGAFIVGASGGTGVLVVRDEKNDWAGPAFYTVGGASFGLQIGAQSSDVGILIMTQRGITSFLSNSLKLGADVGVAAGPIGVGASAATANLSADLISFSRSKGLYGGISLAGAVVAVRDSLNDAYYRKKVTPTQILIQREVTNKQASRLLEEVSRGASH